MLSFGKHFYRTDRHRNKGKWEALTKMDRQTERRTEGRADRLTHWLTEGQSQWSHNEIERPMCKVMWNVRSQAYKTVNIFLGLAKNGFQCTQFCSKNGINYYYLLIGFPLQKGRHTFQNIPSWAEDQCQVIKFEPFIFYPDQKIYIQLTVNHINYSDSAVVHEATTPWVENVNNTQFTACVTRAGRNDYPTDSFATVDWVAYQGSPSGGVAGEELFSRWWTGTTCQTVTFPKVNVIFFQSKWSSILPNIINTDVSKHIILIRSRESILNHRRYLQLLNTTGRV